MPSAQPAMMVFVHAPGCGACRSARIDWMVFSRVAPRLGVLTFDVDITADVFPPIGRRRWTPDKTPTYFLRIGPHGYVMEGAMGTDTLERWVRSKIEQNRR